MKLATEVLDKVPPAELDKIRASSALSLLLVWRGIGKATSVQIGTRLQAEG